MVKKVKNAAAYDAERLVLQETFFKLKIRGFKSRAAYVGAHTGVQHRTYM